MLLYTDYPFTRFGDEPGKEAPIRQVRNPKYDGNKYCDIEVLHKGKWVKENIKVFYIYTQPGRLGEVPSWHYR